MKSTYALVALLAFAVLNTGFLGVHLLSSASTASQSGVSLETSGTTGAPGTSYAPSSTTTTTVTTALATSSAASEQSSASASGVSQNAVASTTTSSASAAEAMTGTASTSAVGGTTTPAGENQTSSAATTSGSATQLVAGVGLTASSSSTSAPASSTSKASTSSTCSGGGSCGDQSSFTQGVTEAGHAGFTLSSFLAFFENHSLALAPGSWVAVGGMWIWRGRMKSRWSDLGFDADVFGLFVKMKGGKTRIKLLDALSLPKDRLQLAQELGMDWKGVDRHLELLKKYGFVQDKVAYGKVRMYELTPVGASLLKLFQELSREEQREAPSAPLSPRLGETAADLVS